MAAGCAHNELRSARKALTVLFVESLKPLAALSLTVPESQAVRRVALVPTIHICQTFTNRYVVSPRVWGGLKLAKAVG
ncbi:MAG TPA: hypothetical protein V6C72_07680 [Chroococcales cyanobacterium]